MVEISLDRSGTVLSWSLEAEKLTEFSEADVKAPFKEFHHSWIEQTFA